MDPNEGTLGDYLKTLQYVGKALGSDTPFVATLFGPLNQAKNLAGFDLMVEHLHRYPEYICPALKIMSENTVRFAQAALNNREFRDFSMHLKILIIDISMTLHIINLGNPMTSKYWMSGKVYG